MLWCSLAALTRLVNQATASLCHSWFTAYGDTLSALEHALSPFGSFGKASRQWLCELRDRIVARGKDARTLECLGWALSGANLGVVLNTMEDGTMGREVAQPDRQTFISTFPPWACACDVVAQV